ncbi:Uncharacterised protein [Pseudomonas aeruginosa]|nr:Uncharacterised protein [Pseudomonas aeruginosa]
MLTKRLRQSGVVASCLLGSVLLIALAFLGWQRFAPVSAIPGWSYRVVLEDIPHVSALARDPDGLLYVSQELQDGKGLVFRIAADGSRTTVLDGLSKPDGMAAFRDGIAISQEQGQSPVFWWHGQQALPLFDGVQVEGVASDGRYLYAAEDRDLDGRILRYDPETGALAVLREGLQRSEGGGRLPGRRRLLYGKETWPRHAPA